jgi:hypothetical protein
MYDNSKVKLRIKKKEMQLISYITSVSSNAI